MIRRKTRVEKITKLITGRISKLPKPVAILAALTLLVGVPALTVAAFTYGPMISVQPESGTLSGGTTTVSDAGASGGQSVKFGTPVAPGSCVGAANEPGGPDPWGGCWPGPHNTGYPKGLPGDTRTPVTLTNYTGPQEINTCGTVIENKIIPWLVLQTGNGTTSKDTPCLTIRNSWVQGTIFSDDPGDGPVLVEDTEIDSDGDIGYAENFGRYNYYSYRVNSHGGQGVIKCAANCETKDSWVHGMTLGGAYHYNAVGGNGMESGSWNIDHNWLSCGDWESTQPGVQDDAGCSAVIGFYGDFDPIRNITINRNYLVSSFVPVGSSQEFRQAGYCINPGYYVGKPNPNPTNMTITDNIFGRGQSGKCGVYGPSNSLNKVGLGATNIWSGNRYADGEVIDRVEE